VAVTPVIPERRGAIEKVMQGLQVASAVYGIKSAYDQNKLNQYKLEEVEKQKLKEQEELETKKRRSEGIFTEQEKTDVLEVTPGTRGSSVGYYQQMVRTPEGKPVYDPDTAKPKSDLKKFHYVSKDSATIQSLVDKNAPVLIANYEAEVRGQGGVPLSDITSGKVKSYSLKPIPGAVKSFIEDPITKARTDIWIPPQIAKSVKTGEPVKEEPTPPKGITGDLLNGWYAAREAGIENPTTTQMQEYSPTFIDKKVSELKKSINENDIELHDALTNFDNQVGIDFGKKEGNIYDKKLPIEGVTTASSYLPTQGLFGIAGRTVLSDESKKNQSAISGVTNVLLKIRSGAAITVQEAESFKNEIQAARGNNDPVALRNAIARVRDKLKAALTKNELGLPPKAREMLKNASDIPSTYSPLFRAKKDASDEDVADQFMRGQ
jgi:hypothetical protein